MAEYHLSAKSISRSAGRSATGAAAYRAGEEITDERTGVVHDYTRKGGVMDAALILPGGGTADRSEFWNSIEKHHKRGDAVLVREVEVSLPTELTKEQRKDLAVGYASELADRYGVAADVALHAPRTITDLDLEKNPKQYHETDPETGRRHNGNWHAHIMLSACHVQPDGTLGKKAVELDPIHCQKHRIVNMVERERPRWSDLANAALERHGHDARIDHRSHAERGIEREPTRHLGPAAAGYERRTKKPSNKRLDFEAEIAERLTRAKEAGELDKQLKATNDSIIVLSVDIDAAKVERLRQQYGHIDDDSDIAAAIKGYGNWGLPPAATEKPAPDWSAYKGTAGSAGSKPLPAAPKAAFDWSAHRNFAGAQAVPAKESIHPGEEKTMEPSSGPGYFPETKEERQHNEEEAKGAQQLREPSKTDDLWARLEREKAEREEKNRERDSGPDFER